MKYWIAVCITLTWAACAQADTPLPLIYSKTSIRILPHAEQKPAQPVGKDANDKNAKAAPVSNTVSLPALPRIAKEFNVEVRPLNFLGQRDFISHQPFTDTEGMMIVIDPPQVAALVSTNMLAKVDVLFVADDGTIAQIAPELSLTNISTPITSSQPIHAFIFLKAGMAKASDIIPGDHVENALFHSVPVVLEDKNSTSGR